MLRSKLSRFTGYSIGPVLIAVLTVLASLVLGYYSGQAAPSTLRKQFSWALPIAALFFVLALSPSFLNLFFKTLNSLSLSAWIKALSYAVCFLVFPLLLLGQSMASLYRVFARTEFARNPNPLLVMTIFFAIILLAVTLTLLSSTGVLLCILGCLTALTLLFSKNLSSLVMLGVVAAALLLTTF